MKVTDNEKRMLKAIANSEYQGGSSVVNYNVWTFSVAKSKADGGTITSLQAKGLVKTSSYEKPGDCVQLTQAGFDVIKNEVEVN